MRGVGAAHDLPVEHVEEHNVAAGVAHHALAAGSVDCERDDHLRQQILDAPQPDARARVNDRHAEALGNDNARQLLADARGDGDEVARRARAG